jgi:cytochrome c-type protein NapB
MKRLGIISLFVILFAAFIAVWNYSYYQGLEEAYIPTTYDTSNLIIPSEEGVFKRSHFALDYLKMSIDEENQRSLSSYYKNRAFPGAPPSIPHETLKEGSIGDNNCLKCHDNGGFVKKFNAYAPVTPHPEMVNCRQCHVDQKTSGVFKENYFVKNSPPTVGNNQALLTSPPMIPHQIQMRENCLSCHAGPSAPKEILVTHPDRVNCRQCHVPSIIEANTNGIFKRGN